MITQDFLVYVTFLLPVCVIVLHNVFVYLMCGCRLIQSRRLITNNRLRFAFAEGFGIFCLILVVMASAYHFLVTRSNIYSLVFSVASIVLAIIIFFGCCARLALLVRRSDKYDVYPNVDDDDHDDTVNIIGAIYFTSFEDGVEMNDIDRENAYSNGRSSGNNDESTDDNTSSVETVPVGSGLGDILLAQMSQEQAEDHNREGEDAGNESTTDTHSDESDVNTAGEKGIAQTSL